MAEILPASNETSSTLFLNNEIRRLRRWTTVSLTFNGLVLLLIVVGAIIHHHREQQGFSGHNGYGGGRCENQGRFGGGHPFHHFGGPGGGRQGGFGGGRFGGDRFRGGNDGSSRFGENQGGQGRFGRGPGGSGMGATPDPAKMTDMILNHLSQKLTLTDDEKAKIKPIIEQQVADRQKQMEAQSAAMQKQMEDAKAKIKPLLTPDQQKQLDAMPLPGQKAAPSGETNPPGR
jgi:hypothetical protein